MDKSSQRKEAMLRRASLSVQEREQKSLQICEKLMSLDKVRNAEIIFSYMAIKDEADLSFLNHSLAASGRKICFPVSGKNGIMQAYVPGSWRKGLYGITEPEPESSELVDPDKISLVLAPCLGFDESGGRLGYGGGYYDRFLPSCINAGVIACAFEVQKMDRVITDELDRKINAAVTEEKIYNF